MVVCVRDYLQEPGQLMVAIPLKKLSPGLFSDITIPPIVWSFFFSCYHFVSIHWHATAFVPKFNYVDSRLKVCYPGARVQSAHNEVW